MSRTEKTPLSFLRRSTLEGLILVIVAALTLEATSLVQYFFGMKGLREEAALRAEGQLEATRSKVSDVINQAESAVHNSIWVAQWCLDVPDSIPRVSQRIVEDNPVVVGSTIALVPGYIPRLPLYSPYVFRDGDSLVFRSLATPEYDYPDQEWFTEPIRLGDGYWSEPYVDEGGGDMMMVTYSVPIRDGHDQTAAVLTADVSLDWLKGLIKGTRIYPNASNILLSREGRFMVSPRGDAALQTKADDVVGQQDDSMSFKRLNRSMLSGESGNMQLHFKGEKSHVFYAPIDQTGWSMCIIVPDSDIFGSIRRVGRLVMLLQILGLLMIILILRSFVKKQVQYNKLNDNKERMEGELRIARGIQMSMVPKTFPPFPKRDDLDMSAAIIPAKEVGGDLYDFYIRDEKLFFCIGDVSGKGVPASLVMAVTRTTFRTISAHESDPQRIVTGMNDILSDMNENNMFVTFFCGVLDLTDGHLAYCNAGHNPPIILTDDIRELPVHANLPLGVLHGMHYESQELQFHHDDALFLYTDGLNEAENAAHEQFGMERVSEALHGYKSSQDHLDNIEQKVSAFVGKAPQSDDFTLLFVHYLGHAEPTDSKRRLVLHNQIREISRLATFLDGIIQEKQLDSSLALNLNLALEEAVTNVISYAYPPGIDGLIDIRATVLDQRLEFTISDDGKPFDPTAAPEADTNLGLAQRRIGGLGIHLVRQIMDTVRYEWKDGRNILTLTKNI